MARNADFRPAEGHRLDAFVDAAFAFAVSLLIIAGGQPLESFTDLTRALMRIPAFLGGFALIVLFWLAHRTWSSLGPQRDGRATLLSLAIVFAVLVFVFPLRLLIETAAYFVSGGRLPGAGLITSFDQLGWTYLIYGLGFSILSVLFALLFRQAQATIDPDDGARRRAADQWARTWALAAVTGVLSGLIALTPALRVAPWLPGVTYWLIPVGIGVFGLIDRRRARKA
jgi:uncharacterized membrane protein